MWEEGVPTNTHCCTIYKLLLANSSPVDGVYQIQTMKILCFYVVFAALVARHVVQGRRILSRRNVKRQLDPTPFDWEDGLKESVRSYSRISETDKEEQEDAEASEIVQLPQKIFAVQLE